MRLFSKVGRNKGKYVPPVSDKIDYKKALDDASQQSRNLLVFFILTLAYVIVTVASTTDEDLLRNSPVTLPVLGVKMSLFSFYFCAPLLVIVFHLNLLINLREHAIKLARCPAIKDERYPFLFNIVEEYKFVKFLTWFIAYFMPLATLTMLQLWYLPSHSYGMNMWHKGMMVADIILITWLWFLVRMPFWREEIPIQTRKDVAWLSTDSKRDLWIRISQILRFPVHFKFKSATHLVFVALFLTISFYIATIPEGKDEKQDKFLAIFDLSRNLSLKEKTLLGAPASEEVKAEILSQLGKDYTEEKFQTALLPHIEGIKLIGKDMRFADFSFTDMRKADLRGADLRGATLQETKLTKADLSCWVPNVEDGNNMVCTKLQRANLVRAELQRANLEGSQLQRAILREAKLQEAYLKGARLDEANLFKAELQGAYLIRTELQGAYLKGAKLQGADLRHAKLQGADLRHASLQGANLQGVEMQGANLSYAELQRAFFYYAHLQGANLFTVELQGAFLNYAHLQGADFSWANLQGAHLKYAQLQGANLFRANLQGAYLKYAELQGAYLIWAKLRGAFLAGAYLKGIDTIYQEKDGTYNWLMDGGIFIEVNTNEDAEWEKIKEIAEQLPESARKDFLKRINAAEERSADPEWKAPHLPDVKEAYVEFHETRLSMVCEDSFVAEGLLWQENWLDKKNWYKLNLKAHVIKNCPKIANEIREREKDEPFKIFE